jgi:hypothetical protein
VKEHTYLYLATYSTQEPEEAIMTVNTFDQDSQHPMPVIRTLAVRTMCRIRLFESHREYDYPAHKMPDGYRSICAENGRPFDPPPYGVKLLLSNLLPSSERLNPLRTRVGNFCMKELAVIGRNPSSVVFPARARLRLPLHCDIDDAGEQE